MSTIDFSDIPEVTRSMKARKNPFYERIMKEGFTVKEYYSPEDIKNIKKGNLLSLRVDMTTLDAEELAAMEEYKRNLVNRQESCALAG